MKEQAAGLYASCWPSGGSSPSRSTPPTRARAAVAPRGLEDPAHRVEDIKAAVSFLTTRAEVDPGPDRRAGHLRLRRVRPRRRPRPTTAIKAVATVSAVDIARQFRAGADGTQDPAVFQEMLDGGRRGAHRRGPRRGRAATFRLFPDTAEEARQGGRHVFEGLEYYCTPAPSIPARPRSFTWSSVDRIATFDAFAPLT